MKKLFVQSVAVLSLILSGCSEEAPEKTLALTSQASHENNNFDTSMQLSELDRIADAESLFLQQFKSVVKRGDVSGFKALYMLTNANPEYVPMIDYIFNKKWTTSFTDLSFSIEPNQKAQKHALYFTVPYLGDLVIKSKSGKGVGVTKIPVGIKDGVYYFTIASAQ